MQLKVELTLIQQGNRSIPDYLHAVKALADAIAIIDHPILDDDLTLYVLNGLYPNFKEIVAPIRARNPRKKFQNFNSVSTVSESLHASPFVLVSPTHAQIDAQPLGQHENPPN
ncbi:uncharacterized protein LOC122277101 [Carya illinoinensis]|uniref:uncharacterized protein LOC122277101 n=1 Tax=Carya illinoinensis TaxID=32201 RepID=UPI001C717F17|nr:uncharacterized protein LOC122277101 [Carya illinoinensis]